MVSIIMEMALMYYAWFSQIASDWFSQIASETFGSSYYYNEQNIIIEVTAVCKNINFDDEY